MCLKCTLKWIKNNLEVKISEWKEQYPNDSFYFRQYHAHTEKDKDCNEDLTIGNDDDDDDVQLMSQENNVKGLLWCHQTNWQRALLAKYGHEICLLDATYKTSKYAVPLFFVCVKTNVNYEVVGSFATQYETTSSITEGLQILQAWNPSWIPKNWMVDFSEAEISALQATFKSKNANIVISL